MYVLDPVINNAIGNTPMISIAPNVYAKLEGQNLFGSAKDRAALYIINYLLDSKQIDAKTELIESSSGNFAIALAGICKTLGMKFTCVIDPLLNPTNKAILECLGANLILVTEPDEHNNYLKSRLSKVHELIKDNNTYWINQYDNPLIPSAYHVLGEEIISQMPNVKYIFVPVSTCGTIAGISHIAKVKNPSIKIVAVDLDCSNIFCPAVTKQHIPGMGLFNKPGNLAQAQIDDIVIVSEWECITECKNLLSKGVFVGVSSGATIAAVKKYFTTSMEQCVVAIFPDRGERYIKTAYDSEWCANHFPQFVQIEKDR